MNEKFFYRKDIDGLRALAILPVLFFHAGLGFTGGYVGVDVFFVISGFLITSIVAREIQQGTFTYKDFWERRIRRIFPASFVVTIVTFLVGFFVFLPLGTEALSKAALAQVLMIANFYFWQQDGHTRVEFEKKIFYYDDNHLSKAGARHVAPLLEEAFQVSGR